MASLILADDASKQLAQTDRLLTVSLIDRSSSMSFRSKDDHVKTRRDLILVAHNAFVEELKKHPLVHQLRFVRSFFHGRIDANVRVKRMKEVDPLTMEEYRLGPGTALYDAIGATLDGIEHILSVKPNYKYVHVIILSDGEENASRKWSASEIRTRIEEKRALGWRIEFFGMSEESLQQAQDIGIPAHQTQRWEPTVEGSTSLSENMTHSVVGMIGRKPTT